MLVSFIYFFLSPFKETQSELLARTAPNIYDVLIAFFGGLVGVIAITRVKKGNPIPGVAIATALMPPLCTAGYGLAIGNWVYFIGAFYLYTINCFFICIATFLITKYLRYQPVKMVGEKYEKQIKYGITALIVIMIVPSFYLAYNLLNEKKFKQNTDQFIDKEFVKEGYTIIYKKISYHSSPKKIELAFLSKKFTADELKKLNEELKEFSLMSAQLIIKQDATDLKSEILNEIGKKDNILSEKDIMINNLRNELDKYSVKDSGVVKEMAILFPKFQNVSIGKITDFPNTDSARLATIVMYSSEKEDKDDEEKLK